MNTKVYVVEKIYNGCAEDCNETYGVLIPSSFSATRETAENIKDALEIKHIESGDSIDCRFIVKEYPLH